MQIGRRLLLHLRPLERRRLLLQVEPGRPLSLGTRPFCVKVSMSWRYDTMMEVMQLTNCKLIVFAISLIITHSCSHHCSGKNRNFRFSSIDLIWPWII